MEGGSGGHTGSRTIPVRWLQLRRMLPGLVIGRQGLGCGLCFSPAEPTPRPTITRRNVYEKTLGTDPVLTPRQNINVHVLAVFADRDDLCRMVVAVAMELDEIPDLDAALFHSTAVFPCRVEGTGGIPRSWDSSCERAHNLGFSCDSRQPQMALFHSTGWNCLRASVVAFLHWPAVEAPAPCSRIIPSNRSSAPIFLDVSQPSRIVSSSAV